MYDIYLNWGLLACSIVWVDAACHASPSVEVEGLGMQSWSRFVSVYPIRQVSQKSAAVSNRISRTGSNGIMLTCWSSESHRSMSSIFSFNLRYRILSRIQMHSTSARSFPGHLVTASPVPAMVAGCDLSTCGPLDVHSLKNHSRRVQTSALFVLCNTQLVLPTVTVCQVPASDASDAAWQSNCGWEQRGCCAGICQESIA